MKLLFIFTFGVFNSSNSKKWFKLFAGNKDLDISILISECSETVKKEFFNEFDDYYNVIFFKEQTEILRTNYVKRLIYVRQIARKIDEINPDVIHIQGCFSTYMVKPLFFTKSKPKIVFNIWGSDFNINYFKLKKHRIIMNWLFRKADLIWANWYVMGNKIKAQFPKYSQKIKTILWRPEGIIFPKSSEEAKQNIRRRFNLNENQYLIISTKAVIDICNHLTAVNSLKYLEEHLDYKIIFHSVRADEQLLKLLKDIIRTNGLHERVIISRDYLTDEEIRALFDLADLCFIIPDIDQLTRPIFETINSDTNLILSNIEPYRYLKDNFGFNLDLVDQKNEKKLAQKFEFYIKNKPQPKWGKEKAIIKKDFNVDLKAGEFINIYKSLLA